MANFMGGLTVGVALGGTAEEMNIRGVDEYLEELRCKFTEFMGIISMRTNLELFFPGDLQAVADDETQLSYLFSYKTVSKDGTRPCNYYQLFIPSDDTEIHGPSTAVTAIDGIIASSRPGQWSRKLEIGAHLQRNEPENGLPGYRLHNFDGFDAVDPKILDPDETLGLARLITADSCLQDEEDWALHCHDRGEHIPHLVYKAEKSYTTPSLSVSVTTESTGFFKHAELIEAPSSQYS